MSSPADARGSSAAVLQVGGLDVGTSDVPLVKDVTLTIRRGERVGLIGESGSGKTLTALAVMGLLPEGVEATGSVRLAGVDHELLGAGEKRMSRVRGRAMAMVFQEPMTALNPTMRVGAQVAEVMTIHRTRRSADAAGAAVELLDQVGLPDPVRLARAYPHQLSGGQRQRVVLAMALANDPALLICDEPTTALDVTVQAQVLNLVVAGVEARDAALLFISHDLAVVARVCERVLVMYGGRVVEAGPVTEVLTAPRHPYTQGLLSASDLERVDERGRLATIPGSVPPAGEFPAGCVFRNRCPRATDVCATLPPWTPRGADGGYACFHPVGVEPGRLVTEIDDGAADATDNQMAATEGREPAVDTVVRDRAVGSEGRASAASADARERAVGSGGRASAASADARERAVGSEGRASAASADARERAVGSGGRALAVGSEERERALGTASAVGATRSTSAMQVEGAIAEPPAGSGPAVGSTTANRAVPQKLGDGRTPHLSSEPIISVRDLRRDYRRPRSSLLHAGPVVEALRGVSFDVMPGERFGIVGESGSGKSTLLRLLAGLEQPTAGTISVLGRPLAGLKERQLTFLRDELQLVFQDPMSSLDPRMRVRDIVAEPLVAQGRRDAASRVAEVIAAVGLQQDAAGRYPHQFSGGQRQRISIARALSPDPSILVADEPVSALDVSLRAQVLNLITDLVDRLNLTLVFVSHDLAVVRHVCDRVAVMHAGQIVEIGPTEQIYTAPEHPYTRELVAAVPTVRSAMTAVSAGVPGADGRPAE